MCGKFCACPQAQRPISPRPSAAQSLVLSLNPPATRLRQRPVRFGGETARALSQLARAGVVDVRGRRITIKNPQQLQAFATPDEDA
jgi:hypothetical protein